jgi:hypothetical protein
LRAARGSASDQRRGSRAAGRVQGRPLLGKHLFLRGFAVERPHDPADDAMAFGKKVEQREQTHDLNKD